MRQALTEKTPSTPKPPEQPYETPEPVIQTRPRRFSIVWLIPLAAAIVGVILVYQTIAEKGPKIRIQFKTAEALDAGKSKIKYKNVEMGVVENIHLSKDLSHVIVIAQMKKEAKPFLSENTRFWVERARVAAGKVSGVQTLLSGAYIAMAPGQSGEKTLEFKGLETPPIVTTHLPGRHFVLQAKRLGSLDIGAPVYFRQIKVGQVVSYNMNEDGKAVTIRIFIHAPHHQWVSKSTRFWNASGMDFVVDAKGIRMNTQSLVTILIGGVAFDTPTSLEKGDPAEENDIFQLYPNYESIFEKTYTRKVNLLLNFDGSVRGLAVGAPVEFRGFRLGKVLDIKLEFDQNKRDFHIPVLIEIEPERITTIEESDENESDRAIMDALVAHGLRARLKTGNLITGQLYVDLDLYPEAPKEYIVWNGKYPRMPTLPQRMDEISASLTQLLNRVQQAPINEFFSDLHHTIQGADRLLNSAQLHSAINSLDRTLDHARLFAKALDTEVAPELKSAVNELNATIKHTQKLTQNLDVSLTPKLETAIDQARATLATIGGSLSQDSPLFHELIRMLRELSTAARFIRDLADYLERHPDALIYGKAKPK